MKRYLTIQEHNAVQAGLHWDLRLENENKGLDSWVIPKHRLPTNDECLLAIQVEEHPWSYREFEGELTQGYGKGSVKLIHGGITEVSVKRSIRFFYNDNFYMLSPGQGNKWFIRQVDSL